MISRYYSQKLSDFSDMLKKKQTAPGQLCLDQKYFVKSAVGNYGQYLMFRGIDKQKLQWIHIYAKKIESNYKMSASIKQGVRNQLCPKVLWTGELQTSKFHSYFEVHERYGPSLKMMFETLKKGPKQREILHLLFQMVHCLSIKIKLIEKMSNAKVVCGELDPQLIVFDASPSKNDLYLLNSFRLKKKNQSIKPMKTKFCSRGAHLGRGLTTKDDLESVCYILIDLFLMGKFLHEQTSVQYQEVKLSQKIEQFGPNIPKTLIEFYHYIISLNLTDEINFFYWKNILTKILTTDVILQPFTFMNKKEGEESESTMLRWRDMNKKQDWKELDQGIEEEGKKEKIKEFLLCFRHKQDM